jgi:hypothetical protein
MKALFVFGFVLLYNLLIAQKTKQIIVGAKVHYGTVFIHTPSVNNIAGSKPYGAELEFSRQPADTASFNKCNCFPRNGIALTYFNFDNPILGTGTSISYFIEPSYKLNKLMQFNLRGAAGLVYVSKPYDAVKNPENKNYTTHINPYLQVGIGLGYTINYNLRMLFMGNFQHFSNGAFKEPNRGLNWITGSVGMLYNPNSTQLPGYKKVSAKSVIDKKIYFDAGVLFVPKQGYNSKIMGQSKFIAGNFVQATKQYGRISAVTGGAEVYYNKVALQTGDESRWVAGIHAGHSFILGRVSFSQQIGYHLYNSNDAASKIYLRYGLLYQISTHINAGINLKSHADNADFTDFRIMYRF